VHYTRNSLNYPFPSKLVKTTQSDITVVIGGNVETRKTAFVSLSKRLDCRYRKFCTTAEHTSTPSECMKHINTAAVYLVQRLTGRQLLRGYWQLIIQGQMVFRCMDRPSVGRGLGFVILTYDQVCRDSTRHCAKSRRSVKPLPKYCDFSSFKMAAVRHLGIGFSKVVIL